jgi:hypothetical protein
VRTGISQNVLLKIGTILLVAIVIAAALFFVTTKSAFAFNPEYVNWQQYPSNPVFDPAERVYYPCIIFNGATYQMWYDDGSGTRYTTSSDGISWAAGTSVIGLTRGRHAVVKWVGTKYMVWYWDSGGIYYSINDIRTAESNDGITWTSDAVITQVGTTVITGNAGVDWNASSYGPCEVFYNPAGSATIVAPVDASTVWQNKFVMYYDGTTGGLEDIGIAVSADGKLWQGYNGGAAPVLAHSGSGWDSDFATFCSVQKIDGIYHMWYSGGQLVSNDGIGYAQSYDGITWTKYASNPIIHRSDGIVWRSDRTYTPRVLYDASGFSGAGESDQLKMWYNGTAAGNYVLGYARITIATPTPTPTPTQLVTVGGRVYPVDKTALLTPYFGVLSGLAIILISGVVWKKLLLSRVNSRKH